MASTNPSVPSNPPTGTGLFGGQPPKPPTNPMNPMPAMSNPAKPAETLTQEQTLKKWWEQINNAETTQKKILRSADFFYQYLTDPSNIEVNVIDQVLNSNHFTTLFTQLSEYFKPFNANTAKNQLKNSNKFFGVVDMSVAAEEFIIHLSEEINLDV